MNHLEVVYYSSPVVQNNYTVTVLGILFDRVYLPGVYLPSKPVERKLIRTQFEDVVQYLGKGGSVSSNTSGTSNSSVDESTLLHAQTLKFVYEYQELFDIFVGTGQSGYMGVLEPGADELAREFETAIFGPPPEGFHPNFSSGHNFPIGDDQVNGPSSITYPPNAFLFAESRGLPLISDRPGVPNPAREVDPNNADQIAAHLAVSSVSSALPKIRPLSAAEILTAKDVLKDEIDEFHLRMLSYVSQVRSLLAENATEIELAKEADFIANTQVLPSLHELVARLESRGSIAKDESLKIALKDAPMLLTAWANHASTELLVATAAGAVGKRAYDAAARLRTASQKQSQSGLSLLIKLPQRLAG